MTKPVIAVCMPIARAAHPNTMRSLLNLRIPRPYHFFDVTNMQVDNARNLLTEGALYVPEVTHLMWIDDDMVFTPDALERLLAHDLDVVGGLCFSRRHPFPPILIHKTVRGYSYRYDYPEGLVKVDATGGAFLLTKRKVYEDISKKFPGVGYWKPDGVGEDISFCNRATACGYDIHVDTTVKIGHMAECNVMDDFARRNRAFEVNPYFPPREVIAGAPRASIVIPTWNQKPAWLLGAIDSAKQQTVPVEIIVVDDGSDVCPWCYSNWTHGAVHTPGHGTDFYGPVCTNLTCPGQPVGIKFIRLPENHGSPWRAINAGIKAMTTDYFTWLSSDDLLYPTKVERQLAAMAESGSKASFHGYDVLLAEGMVGLTVWQPPMWKDRAEQQMLNSQGCYINGLTAMLHRDVFDAVGYFSEEQDYQIVADWEFWLRVGEQFFWQPINAVLATRRDFDNASERYRNNPEKRAQWIAEDERVRAKYAHCNK